MNKINIKDLYPKGEPEILIPAWLGFLHWAIGKQEVRERFETESGLKWTAPQNGLEAMIDDATGHTDDYLKRFIQWATETYWGSTNDNEKHT